jgi:beta-N-acetylhexosaminidase
MRVVTASALLVIASLAASGCTSDADAIGAASSSDAVASPTATAGAGADEAAETPEVVSSAGVPASPEVTAVSTSWGPSQADWRRAGRIVSKMSVTEQAGRVLVATYDGLEPPVDLVRELGLGGVIVMGDNVPQGSDTAESLASITQQLQSAAEREYPLIVSVDQEGGPVSRVGTPATEFPPGMAHGAADDLAASRRAAAASGRELAALGFTMSFAPVADVTAGLSDPTIGVRSPGDRPGLVARVARAQVRGLSSMGVVPVLKHFPGHGSVPADSHLELPVQTAKREQLERRDLVPFARAVEDGAPAVMVAHIDVRDVDPGVPSSLSRKVVTGMLRDDVGFEGVVVTDSLGMAAVADRYTSAESAVAALQAGVDLLLMPPDVRAARDGVVAAVRSGQLDGSRLTQAARRVVALQLHQAALAATRPDLSVVGSSAKQSRRLSAAAATLVDGPCEGRLVGSSIQILGGTETDRSRLAAAAQRAGLRTGSGDVVVLLGSGGSAGSGTVVVALDTPYGLGRSSASSAKLALFGRTPHAFELLVDVLTGRAAASGTLPVSVAGVSPPSC